ncbi:MAG: TonB-dependent receptor [Cyclobacteriaceae bacterium]|nr:TonB-dependent receptor [Cyclobacteriaceae bacterium]MCH8516953.1 TonB-dependent receptor [Cyclobacteriaceae bacterium]
MKQKYIVFLFVISFGLSITVVKAQDKKITGTVTATGENEGLPGVSILAKESGRGVATDLDGKYEINLRDGENTLEFSFIGFRKQVVEIGNRSVIDVVLKEDVESLDEVVVIGYGSVRKSDLTGSVSSVKSDDIVKIPAANPAQALQGKVAGLQVNSASGAPGAQPVLRLRGVGTFGNAAPVYVVDGVILDDVSFLTAADIESIEVLKDASAISMYGSRGANGVVLISTKRGKTEKPQINVNTEFSIQTVPDQIDLLNGPQFGQIVNEIRPGTYNNVNALPNTDWQSQIFSPALIQNHQVSASGKKDDFSYFFSAGYFEQDGIIDKSNFQRLTIRLNNEYRITERVRVGNNISLAPSRQQNTAGDAVFQSYRAQPIVEPFTEDGSYSEVPGVGNPLASIEYNNSFNRAMRTVGNLFLEVEPIDGLVAKSSFGVDLNNSRNESFTPVYFVSPQQQNDISRLNKGFGEFSTLLWENTLNYSKEIDVHRIDAVGGFTMQDTRSESFGVGALNILRDSPDFWYINPNNINENSVSNSVDFNQNYSMISYLGRVNYSYDERFLLTGTFRVDGSSKFLENNRYAAFPSVAAGWNIINEAFMEQFDFFTNLKIRASWGRTGNDRVPYDRAYSRVLNQIDGVFGNPPEIQAGATYGVFGNPDLVWETTTQSDIGLEIGLFNNKLIAEFDYFHRVTDDILVDLAVPGYQGNGPGALITFNAGSVLNRGLEFNVSYRDNIGDFSYKVGALGNTLHNEVLAISGIGGEGDELVGGLVFNRFVTRSTVGLPVGYFYGFETDGVFQNQGEVDAYPSQSAAGPGDLRYVDTNGDGRITQADRTYLGSAIPDLIYGFNFELNWKQLSMSADFQGELGRQLYNAKESIRPDLYNFEAHVLDRWRGEGTSNTQPRPTEGGYNWQPSDRFVQDGSYLRLRNLTLGYTLRQSTTERMRMKNARVYVSGTNLLTLTSFSGFSPEFASESVLANGLDLGGYPVTAIYSVGLNLTF